MALSGRQIRHLRRLGHGLKPCLTIGQAGITGPVVQEACARLQDHELIKVKIRISDRGTRSTSLQELLRSTDAQLIQTIGHVALIYRAHPDGALIALPA